MGYNVSTKQFVAAGKFEAAARDAAARDEGDARRIKQAQQAALLCAKKLPPLKEPSREPAVKEPPNPQDHASSR
jgi:hypothetical protein